jgi:hypothetical protein
MKTKRKPSITSIRSKFQAKLHAEHGPTVKITTAKWLGIWAPNRGDGQMARNAEMTVEAPGYRTTRFLIYVEPSGYWQARS